MKKVSKTYCALCIFNLLCLYSYAQQGKDTVLLSEVSVTDYRSKNASQNFQQLKIDSTTQSAFSNSTMPQMLMQQNACFVKSYGPGNISALSIRGSSAQQTAVIWNGMNINNPMLGQADVSLLPVGFFNSISMQKGALSGYWGSGAMAGVLNLQSEAKSTSGFVVRASTSYSSLLNSVNWASVNFSSGKWSSATRILADVSKNQYNYLLNDSTATVQMHAQTKQFAFMQDVNYQINTKQQLGLHFWLQDAQRQVPYTLSEIREDNNQYDKIFRMMADWKLDQKKYSLTARTAFFNEALLYFYNNKTSTVSTSTGTGEAVTTIYNNNPNISSNSFFKTFMGDIEGQFYLPKGFTVTAGNTNSVSFATTEGYAPGLHQISRVALYQNISWNKNFYNTSVYGRQELFNLKTFVPTAGAAQTITILKCISWKINAGTIYRYPTLNDLYWNPGGNINLKPETGYSAETSLQLNKQVRSFSFLFGGTVFTRNISNCIMWMPGANGMWSPQNVLQVWSRGGETNSEISFRKKNVKTSLNLITNYILSNRTKTVLQNDVSLNRQMTYVPMYSGSAIFSFEYKNWMLRVACSYTGYRYLSSDNYSYLVPFTVLDARIARTFVLKNILLNVFAEGNNLLNENYQSVTQYPMPLRNFKAGIILQYQKAK
jgi:vitamin B12 transporter